MGHVVGFVSAKCVFVCLSVLILDARQKRAEELRRLTDQSASMSEEQLSELRAEIKVLEQNCCSISFYVTAHTADKM